MKKILFVLLLLCSLVLPSNSYAEPIVINKFNIFDYPVLDFSGDFIAGSGISDDDKKSLIPVGTVSIWTHESVPEFWLECDGRAVDAVKYPELRKLMSFLPDYRDRFLQGKSSKYQVNQSIEAGLPNVTGSFNAPVTDGIQEYTARGAFIKIAAARSNGYWGVGTNYGLGFDASLSNPIYGKSTTVQPPAVIVKYIIKAE